MSEMVPFSAFEETLRTRFGGVLLSGCHSEDGKACVLECAIAAKGLAWGDSPEEAGLPDLRPLNDACWQSDEERTKHMLPVVEALWEWEEWGEERKQRWAEVVALRTVKEILPPALRAAGLGLDEHADACANARDLVEAAEAPEVELLAAAWASAARADDDSSLLPLACQIWIDAANQGEEA